jgi:hypothetical protein
VGAPLGRHGAFPDMSSRIEPRGRSSAPMRSAVPSHPAWPPNAREQAAQHPAGHGHGIVRVAAS